MFKLLSKLFGPKEIHVHLHIDKPINIITNQSMNPYNTSGPDKEEEKHNKSTKTSQNIQIDNIDLPEIEFGEQS